jgi:hypothetical protein
MGIELRVGFEGATLKRSFDSKGTEFWPSGSNSLGVYEVDRLVHVLGILRGRHLGGQDFPVDRSARLIGWVARRCDRQYISTHNDCPPGAVVVGCHSD